MPFLGNFLLQKINGKRGSTRITVAFIVPTCIMKLVYSLQLKRGVGIDNAKHTPGHSISKHYHAPSPPKLNPRPCINVIIKLQVLYIATGNAETMTEQ